jgi:hypothetical protein
MKDETQPTQISREDMLRLSNINLRMENVRLQEELMRRDRENLQREMTETTEALNRKYGLDPTKHRVLPDGTIVLLEALANAPRRA